LDNNQGVFAPATVSTKYLSIINKSKNQKAKKRNKKTKIEKFLLLHLYPSIFSK